MLSSRGVLSKGFEGIVKWTRIHKKNEEVPVERREIEKTLKRNDLKPFRGEKKWSLKNASLGSVGGNTSAAAVNWGTMGQKMCVGRVI